MELIFSLIVGAIAGWLAGQIIRGYGFGLIGNIIVGVVGGFIGGAIWTWAKLPPIGPGWLTAIIAGTLGAVILLFVIGLIRR